MNKLLSLVFFVTLFSSQSIIAQNNKNIKAIKNVIAKEVDALNRDHDLDAYLSCFAQSDKVQVGPENGGMTVGYEAIKTNAEKVIDSYDGKANPNTWSFTNWDIYIKEKTAFARCLQTTKTAQGTFIDVYKSDYLEKIKGQWKIVDHRYFHIPERTE